MRLYDATVTQFRDDVTYNIISEKVGKAFQDYYCHSASKSELNAWQQSFNYLKSSCEVANLSDNRMIIEYELPYSARRIDVLLFGRNEQEGDGVVLIELKQWGNDGVFPVEADGNVKVRYASGLKEVPHPSWQVQGYHYDLKDFLHIFQEKDAPVLSSIAYCHNYARLKEPNVLFTPKFEAGLKKFPLFAKEDVEELGKYLHERLGSGAGILLVKNPIQLIK